MHVMVLVCSVSVLVCSASLLVCSVSDNSCQSRVDLQSLREDFRTESFYNRMMVEIFGKDT